MAHKIGPTLKLTPNAPDEIPSVAQVKGETAGKVTILDDKIEGRDAERKTLRES